MPIDMHELSKMTDGDTWVKKVPPSCPACGYILVGVPKNICPECGRPFQRRRVEQFASDLQMEMRRLRDMNDMVDWSLKLLIAGAVILLIGVLRGNATPTFGEAARCLAIIVGFLTTAFGLNVLRVNRLPFWVREHMDDDPKIGLGQLTGVLGVALIVASIAFP